MHICRCFSIISPFKIASLPFILTVAIFQMGSLLYLHAIFIFISFTLSGLLYGSLKTIFQLSVHFIDVFQAHTAFIAKRNLFSQMKFAHNSNRMFTMFALSRAVELTGNLLGFVVIAVTFSSQNASTHKTEIPCGRDFCFEINPPSLSASVSPITNLFAIYNRNFIHIAAQFTLYSLLCIAVFIAAIPLRSTHLIFNNLASDQSPIDILAKSSLNDIFPLPLASGYLEVFIFYEISNAITYCVTHNILTVCTIFIFTILFITIFILFITIILTNEVSLDAIPLFCAILTAYG
ncbi:unnamed protein product [Anisakis simplex]|uniref:G protein-coupled receptor n=1 Tax=Anisakis simplex TaxID=6269 RepID=A0A0M3K5L7_ANISI|nr:unnamed protein product [Anisakis simplex]